jgi:hypothetical protein
MSCRRRGHLQLDGATKSSWQRRPARTPSPRLSPGNTICGHENRQRSGFFRSERAILSAASDVGEILIYTLVYRIVKKLYHSEIKSRWRNFVCYSAFCNFYASIRAATSDVFFSVFWSKEQDVLLLFLFLLCDCPCVAR